MLRVLRILSRTARRFGAGELSARAEVSSGHGELTDLTRAFNAMADALAERQREAVESQARLRALSHRLVVAREADDLYVRKETCAQCREGLQRRLTALEQGQRDARDENREDHRGIIERLEAPARAFQMERLREILTASLRASSSSAP